MDYCNYTRNISRAVAHTEKRIRTKAPLREAAQAAGMSEASFWRVFKQTFNTTLSTYKRERRLTMVARRLISTNKTITDICLEYGCDSPEIITRAFKKHFGVTPMQYRKAGVNMHFLERQRLSEMTIRHVMCGGISGRPVLRKDGGFCIRGYKGTMKLSNGIRKVTGIFTRHVMRQGREGEYSVFYAGAESGDSLLHVGRETPLNISLGSRAAAGCRRVPYGRYAVFMHDGPAWTMLASYEYIFGYWLRGKRRAGYPRFVFQKIDNSRSNIRRVRSEIFIPV